jgi:1-acyl-sn-glycerol-3-phosphate acyltransferase
MRFIIWMLIHTFYKVDKKGLDNIPEEGAAVLVCNHVSFVDALVIGGVIQRPIRFVMDHRIFRVPVLSFIFRTMRTIPIAPAREDAAMKESAFAEAARALAAGEIVGIFPEGRLTESGEMGPFRPGVQQMIATTPVPVVPMALFGLWGSVFSRSCEGKALRRLRGVFSRIGLAAAPPIAPHELTMDGLRATVLLLRGDRR